MLPAFSVIYIEYMYKYMDLTKAYDNVQTKKLCKELEKIQIDTSKIKANQKLYRSQCRETS